MIVAVAVVVVVGKSCETSGPVEVRHVALAVGLGW